MNHSHPDAGRGISPTCANRSDRVKGDASVAKRVDSAIGAVLEQVVSRQGAFAIETVARKDLPLVDVALCGGWRDLRSLENCYTLPDSKTILRVVTTENAKARPRKSVSGFLLLHRDGGI
jgi:hypothetical protein